MSTAERNRFKGLLAAKRAERETSAKALGLCCALHAFNTADGTHPDWPCQCLHCQGWSDEP